MAKASRSKSTKLPEFDPSELEDLIFTPAVGSGVGSHLLQQVEEAKGPPTVDLATVDRSGTATVDLSTVAMEHSTTVDDTLTVSAQPLYIKDIAEAPTVVKSMLTTVVEREVAPVCEPATEAEAPTVDMATVVAAPPISLWLTETGEIVPASRVKRIRLAQDVLSPAEESVYDTLWGVKSAAAFKEERENYRVVQAGYDFLMKRTRLSKKTIQRIVDRLIDKGFIAIEKPADIYLRSSTVYRVFSYRAVLDRQAQRGRFHVAKIGPGFVYVREVADPRAPTDPDMTTVVNSSRSTVGSSLRSTERATEPATGAVENPTTVATAATRIIEQGREGSPPSSTAPPAEAAEARELRILLERHLGFIDDDASRQLLRQCRLRAADCTLEEIGYFVSHKLRSVNGIHNPVGFILTAVPRHFENNGHSSVRAFLREEAERRRRIWHEEYRYWRGVADDREAPPEERAQAREVIASLEKSADRP